MEAPNCDTILVLYKISRFSAGEMTWHCNPIAAAILAMIRQWFELLLP